MISVVRVAVNQAMCDHLKRSRAELVGRKIDRDILPPTLAQFQAAWERLIQLDDAIAEVEAVRSDGMLLRSQFAARATVIEGRRLVLGVLLWGDAVVAP